MVQAMKRALTAIGGSILLREEEFVTFLARAADLLNSRPLVRDRKGDLYSALTPNHFLVGRVSTGLDDKVANESKLLGERYRNLERSLSGLWEKFFDEVLLDARSREKWRFPTRDIQAGELVLVLEAGALGDKWKTGVVEESPPRK